MFFLSVHRKSHVQSGIIDIFQSNENCLLILVASASTSNLKLIDELCEAVEDRNFQKIKF